MKISMLLLIFLLACSDERDYRGDWTGAWKSDANSDALYRFSLDGTWTGWLISNPDEEQNNGTYSVTKDRYRMTCGAIYGGKSFYRYEEGRWEIIGEKLVLYEDAPVNGNDNTRFANVNVARVYTRRRIILK